MPKKRKVEFYDKNLKQAWRKVAKIEGFEAFADILFYEACCPLCNHVFNHPFFYHVFPDQTVGFPRGFSRRYGVVREDTFDAFWNANYKDRFGVLDVEEKTRQDRYASLPDRYNKCLKTHFEIKLKIKSWQFIENKDGLCWINKTSVNKKYRHQKSNPNELYVFVIFFIDKGWHTVEVSKAYGCSSDTIREYASPFYQVPLTYFNRFENFIEQRISELKVR